MSMKKQPTGVRRTARVAGEKPPQSYDLYFPGDTEEIYLGWSERLPKGMWQAHPAAEHTDADIPPFKEHTALITFLIDAHEGAAHTSEGGQAAESEQVLKSSAYGATSEVEDTYTYTDNEGEESIAEGALLADETMDEAVQAGEEALEAEQTEAILKDEFGPEHVPDAVMSLDGNGGSSEAVEPTADPVEADPVEAVSGMEAETTPPGYENLVGASTALPEAEPSAPDPQPAEVVAAPFRAPSPQGQAPETEPALDAGAVLFKPPAVGNGDATEWEYPAGEGHSVPPAPVDVWAALGRVPVSGSAQDVEDMS